METKLQQSYTRSEVAQLRDKWSSEWDSETTNTIKSLLIGNIKDLLNQVINIDPDYIMLSEHINDFIVNMVNEEGSIKDIARNYSCRELMNMFRASEYCNA